MFTYDHALKHYVRHNVNKLYKPLRKAPVIQSIITHKYLQKKDNQNVLHYIHYITLLERWQF